MSEMNLRQAAYFALVGLRGQALGNHYKRILREDQDGIPPDTTKRLLIQLLTHCKQSVPYYAEVIREMGDSFCEDPEGYLRRFPILTKDTIRSHFDELKSNDLVRRKWYLNTTGGSTGEPVQFIQDWEYAARSGAITLLFSKLAGREIGESEVRIWGSLRDITGSTEGLRTQLVNKLTNTTFLSVFRLTPSNMREYIGTLNTTRPNLIVGYAGAMYELAKFAEGEGLEVAPQAAIITSAVTLYPFMRDTIERVFQCRVFNRYGSREVGDIACERPGLEGLWVAPWGNYVEIVDREGNRLPDGTEGEILVTSLTNFAMPLVRYRIGDRGVLSCAKDNDRRWHGQILERFLGRTYDMFINKHGTLVEGGHFMALLYFRDWISKYQVIQESHSRILFRIVKSDSDHPQAELDEISAKTRFIMNDDCEVAFEFVDEIVPSNSGKHRFIISEIQA
jgi:phenylacetate-CoA ligase